MTRYDVNILSASMELVIAILKYLIWSLSFKKGTFLLEEGSNKVL